MVRNASADCIRQLLPALISRIAREPAPTALPHSLLQRIALHHLVELVFDPNMITVSIVLYTKGNYAENLQQPLYNGLNSN